MRDDASISATLTLTVRLTLGYVYYCSTKILSPCLEPPRACALLPIDVPISVAITVLLLRCCANIVLCRLREQDNLRFVSWPSVSEGHYVLHPDPITNGNVGEAMQSGALFARKFDLEVSYTPNYGRFSGLGGRLYDSIISLTWR